jgi:hypothetical protein
MAPMTVVCAEAMADAVSSAIAAAADESNDFDMPVSFLESIRSPRPARTGTAGAILV